MPRRTVALAALMLAALTGTAYTTFGGWAVITVDDLPEYVTAGKPVEIAFTVRQHGVSLMENLRPVVYAKDAKSNVQASAVPGDGAGRYTATLVVPRPGDWTITINSSFMNNQSTLAPITAIAAGTTPPKPLAAAERGRVLFVAKGCVTCHVHDAVPGSGKVAVGPNLTPKRYQADYLAKFLVDPSIGRTPASKEIMPRLELKANEISAITAFINR